MGRRIGIRVADGTFYPILDGDEDGRRRLVVTTAQDNQTVLRIQFVREGGAEGADSAEGATTVLGTLEFEAIDPAPKSDADIELLVGVDAGTLNAWARDIVSGEKHELSVSLSDAEFDDFDLPDLGIDSDDGSAAIKEEAVTDDGDDFAPPEFDADDFDTAELGDDEVTAEAAATEPDVGVDAIDDAFDLDAPTEEEPVATSDDSLLDDDLTGDAYPMGAAGSRRTHLVRQRRGRMWMLAIIVGAIILLAVAAVVVIRGLATESSPPWVATVASWGDAVLGERAPAEQGEGSGDGSSGQGAADAGGAGDSGGARAAGGAGDSGGARAAGGAATGDTAATPATPSGGSAQSGEVRTVRRGDTLWDLANSYYQNPWKYPEIARRNNIANPDLILAGTEIFIPEL